MKSLLKWLIKKFIDKDSIKLAIRSANEKLARTQLPERKARALGWGESASAILAVYLKAFADDGKIDDGELEEINDKCCAVVDEYLPNEDSISDLIDAIIG